MGLSRHTGANSEHKNNWLSAWHLTLRRGTHDAACCEASCIESCSSRLGSLIFVYPILWHRLMFWGMETQVGWRSPASTDQSAKYAWQVIARMICAVTILVIKQLDLETRNSTILSHYLCQYLSIPCSNTWRKKIFKIFPPFLVTLNQHELKHNKSLNSFLMLDF